MFTQNVKKNDILQKMEFYKKDDEITLLSSKRVVKPWKMEYNPDAFNTIISAFIIEEDLGLLCSIMKDLLNYLNAHTKIETHYTCYINKLFDIASSRMPSPMPALWLH